MGEPRFCIVGSGRSGSKYISELLRACGINCGHEEWWSAYGRLRDDLDGGSSWLATFDREFSGIRLGQIRDPNQSIPSMAGPGFEHQPHKRLREMDIGTVGNRERDVMRTWIYYSVAATTTTDFWWRVEDVDRDIVHEIARIVDLPVCNVDRALQRVPKNVNGRGSHAAWMWPDAPETEVVRFLAQQWGYDEPR